MVSDQVADEHDAIFTAASQAVSEFAAGIAENYQEVASGEVVAAWPVGCALVVNGAMAMANASVDLSPTALAILLDDVLAYIGARIVELHESQVAA